MKGKLIAGGWIVFSALGLVAGQAARAQAPADAQKRYKAAVRLVQTGDYTHAKTDLNAIIQRGDTYAPYAHYYYALAGFRQKDFTSARLMLKQLMSRFPNWSKMNDAQYLFAAVCMETGQYEDGLTALQRIGDPALRPDVVKMEQYFLGRITNLNRLKQINREYPDNRNVGLALIDLIQRTATDKSDLELSDRLTNRFGLPARPVAVSQPVSGPVSRPTTGTATPASMSSRPVRAKGYYNVAVLFPFRIDEFDADKRGRTNQYAYDLYDGIKMAKTHLQDEGITVNLFAYDIDNDANKALELISSPAFAQTDLIIGPLYTEPNRIATAFANQNGVALINPIATSSELIANQPMAFLAQPSVVRQAQKAAEQARTLNGSRRAAVYFGTARKDSLLALAYQAELKRLNYQIVDFRRLGGGAQAMAEAMTFSGPGTSMLGTPTPNPSVQNPSVPGTAPVERPGISLGHVFFASSNDDDGPRLLDALSRRRVSGPVIATASAFDYYRNSISTFTRRDLYLLYPDFMDTSRPAVTEFQEQYAAKRNLIPSVFACQGYDLMLFFGRQLARSGLLSTSRANLRSDTDDYLLSGFDYTQNNENLIVPIVKYEDGRFVKIN